MFLKNKYFQKHENYIPAKKKSKEKKNLWTSRKHLLTFNSHKTNKKKFKEVHNYVKIKSQVYK